MNKKSLKFCSAIISLATLMSPFSILTSSAEEAAADSNNQNQSINIVSEEEEDFSSFGTGDLSFENGELPDDSKVIKSTDEYYNIAGDGKLTIHSSGDALLPDSVDNSESEYFPKIDSQGSVGSCVAWANAYYQFTYTINKLMGVPTTDENTFSPKWIYNFANGGNDLGSSPEDVYSLMKEIGNVPITMVPYDYDYTTWSPQEEIWKTAARYRLSDFQYFDEVGEEETQITSPDDSDLEVIKTALANGEVLTYTTCIYSWESTSIKANSGAPENDSYVGQEAVYARIGSDGSHRMTLVGYNDNIWIDINNNDAIDDGEMGAFKIANSWGTGYGNNGFMWVAYDALNKVTSVENGPTASSRQRIFSFISRIDVLPYDSHSNLYLTCTLNSKNRSETNVYIIAEKDGTEISYQTPPRGKYSSKYSYDGTENANDGVLAFPLDSVIPGITSETFDDYTWYVKFEDKTADGNIFTVKDAVIEDVNTNTTYRPENIYPLTLDGEEYTAEFAETTSNNVVIYYQGYENALLHYKTDGGEWNTESGEDMLECYERHGYSQKFVIPLDTLIDVNLYFSDANGNIDDNNGQYFTATRGLNYYITENAREPLTAEISNNFNSYTDKSKLCKFNVDVSGGYETYQYQFIYKHIESGTETVDSYRDNCDTGYFFRELGTYLVTVNVKDFTDNVYTTSMEITVDNIPFEFTEFTVTPGESIIAGQELTFDAVTNNEAVIYKGPNSWDYTFNVKRNGEPYYSETVFSKTTNLSYKTSIINVLWIPTKSGTYTVTISRTDADNEYAEGTVEFIVKDKLVGDAYLDGDVNSADVMFIQRYDINLVNSSDISLETADCNKDGIISLRDATCIQKYMVGYSNAGYAGDVIEIPDPTPIDSDSDTDSDTDSDEVKTNKVTFTNSFNWSGTIYCYYWSDANKNMTAWPGTAMTNAGKNQFNETLYTFTVPDEATYIIFTNGSSQTVDISYGGGEVRYYPLSTTDSQGHFNVATW